ncbi:hypothetical protein [Bradyrhizobium sp. CCBAU 51627]|uniref:hypothetical protein n=1 Tax=Bradyrhizobium sp. CCBAU 51627 TaxID=1325088 RepID=UPI002306B8BB|nr:hypothetical protein [Bradyrhizobium sp. CCBAU 51627]MDA9432229.1 hypothetical protein [Bradyrhizobium sp. CCBAU 51627]
MYRLIMALHPDALPTDPATLTELVLALQAENEKLRVTMQTLKEMIFGKHSEWLAAQLKFDDPRQRTKRRRSARGAPMH